MRLTGEQKWFNHISLYGDIYMREFLNITKALADETRVRILLALQNQELCVCQITELFGLAQSTVSKHLSVLYQAGLVNYRKEGRWMIYALPVKTSGEVRAALGWARKSLANDPTIAADGAALKKVLRMDPVELCKKQCQR